MEFKSEFALPPTRKIVTVTEIPQTHYLLTRRETSIKKIKLNKKKKLISSSESETHGWTVDVRNFQGQGRTTKGAGGGASHVGSLKFLNPKLAKPLDGGVPTRVEKSTIVG